MLCAIVAMLFGAVLNYFLVPKFGATGAAISTAISFYIFFLMKTAISLLVWHKIKYFKSVVIVTLLLILTISNLFFVNYDNEIYCFWVFLLCIGAGIFRDIFNKIYKLIKRGDNL